MLIETSLGPPHPKNGLRRTIYALACDYCGVRFTHRAHRPLYIPMYCSLTCSAKALHHPDRSPAEVLNAYETANHNLAEMARQMGISRERTRQLVKKARLDVLVGAVVSSDG
jgi:predicted DNA-binding protein (UPF0251 family)